MTISVSDALDTLLESIHEEREADGFYHPSSLFSCDRQAVYNQRGTPRSDSKAAKDLRPLEIGKLLHTLLQMSVTHQVAVGAILQAWHEVKVLDPELKVKGSADSLLMLKDGTFEIEEFKSTKSAAVKYAKGGFTPRAEHISQALSYVRAIRLFPWVSEDGETHEPLGDRLSRARIVYFTKDDSDILEFVFELTPEWEASFVAFMRHLLSYEDSDVLPPRLPEKNWLCKSYCEWRTRCWNRDGEGEVL